MAQPLWPARVKIYLNEGKDHFFGFGNERSGHPPRLRLAVEFELTQADCTVHHGNTMHQVPTLSLIFEQLNVGGEPGVPATDWTKRYRAQGNRSLSVGDVVAVGEKFYACASVGWTEVGAFEVAEAIADYEKLGSNQ